MKNFQFYLRLLFGIFFTVAGICYSSFGLLICGLITTGFAFLIQHCDLRIAEIDKMIAEKEQEIKKARNK
jgi:uncharacterized membrane protein